jgi:hypothetical protein
MFSSDQLRRGICSFDRGRFLFLDDDSWRDHHHQTLRCATDASIAE